ncbi:hypothetical protein BKA67DRAFT_555042 [Truncatella angustata]|uniref:1-phosphatidylinositol-3-phosphate 5-kinase n=1 Tax=Truncatella angustata TaxID=152316 RepID=A0A9P8USF3_9PEZI|nr:uncharacterized protein BKA67DRAFT_555042 [Truncatella angustata]KAH6657346.1 hypothetical protein BKA67DRAFT_555042 [Truncatella angustata]
MSTKHPPLQPQASPMTIASPTTSKARRDSSSWAGPAQGPVRPAVSQEQLAQALDKIHDSANQRDVLTTFNELNPPPESSTSPENKGFAGDLVQSGFSGLYSRFKEAVGVTGREKGLGQDDADTDAASKRSSSTTTTTTVPKASISRIDTGLTISTLASGSTDSLRPPSGGFPETSSQQQAAKYLGSAASGTTKSASSSRQNISTISKSVAVVAPVTVSAFKDAPRSASSRADDISIRTTDSRKSSARPNDNAGILPNLEIPGRYDNSESKSAASLEKIVIPSRQRRDEIVAADGNLDSPVSPAKSTRSSAAASVHQHIEDQGLLSPTARPSARDAARRPAVIDRITGSRNRGSHSRSSSLSQSTAEPSNIISSAHQKVRHDTWGRDDRPHRMKSGAFRIPGTTTDEGAPDTVNATLEHMRKQVLSKDFWMADEACKECFHCGAPFSAFRRKHHCRTCGCIFDSRCTTIISGQKFGVAGTLRVCKRCLDIISQRQQDANISEDSADDSYLPAIFRSNQKSVTLKLPDSDKGDTSPVRRPEDYGRDVRSLDTPMMAIPTRRIGESSNRNSAILEIDAPQLSRPSSSRSLKSLAARPQSSSHKRHHSKHNLFGRFKPSPAADDRAPFRRSANEEIAKKTGLPAFHDDNVIDPDLAPFMSDESSGDEQTSISQIMAGGDPSLSTLDSDKSTLGPYLGAGRRNRLRYPAEKSISGLSVFNENGAPGSYIRSSRKRNASIASASVYHLRSPRPRSAHLRGPAGSTETLPTFEGPATGIAPRLTRSSSMKGEKAPRVELNPASLSHVRKLLQQLLRDSEIPNLAAWEKALMPILLKCTTSVDPDVESGDDIDIRHYVKLKKIPGGRPGDTSYISGVIFTKKLAQKSMPRRLASPRVVIVSFPIEYRRHQQHFMSLKPAIDEEKEFLKVIVSRIVTLRPQLVLAEKSVSGLALQYLSEHNIAVAYNVKPSVIYAVSRCLEAPIISSIDMLSLPVERFRVGRSVGFEVKTYVNEEIPGRKKTYMFLSSSNEQLGCTIALRGAPTPILTKIKQITDFMIYVVYNLKLESCLMRDSYIQLPDNEELPSQHSEESKVSLSTFATSDDDARQRSLSTMTFDELPSQSSVESNRENETPPESDSAIAQANQQINKLISLHETHGRASNDSLIPDDAPMPTFYSDMVAKYQTRILSASPFVRFAQPYLLMRAREQERRLVHLKKLRDQDIVEERGEGDRSKPQKFQLIKPHMVHQTGQKAPRAIMEVLHAVHDVEYDKALYNYRVQTRQWENHIKANLDFFEPSAHQNIVVLYSVVCTENKVPCVEPGLIAIQFYDEHAENDKFDSDCTLGQYIEDVCYGADSICTGTSCDRKMLAHHRTYVHGDARITFFLEQNNKKGISKDSITMWSYCKNCKKETAETEMSQGTWKYSFGKYLELSFWSRGTRLVNNEDGDAWDCPHDHHRDHIRYFGLQDKVVRVHYDPIDLLEIVAPRARITWKVEHDLNLKNEIFTAIQDRWSRFTASIKARIKAIRLDNIAPEKAEACKTEVERLTKKVQDDHVLIIRRLQDSYMNSKYYEVIPLSAVLRGEIFTKVTEWDAAFAKFEIDFLPTEKDLRRLTMLQLRKMFTDESKESLISNETPTETPDATEKPSQMFGPESAASEISEVSGISGISGISEERPSDRLTEKEPVQIVPDLDMSVGADAQAAPVLAPDAVLERAEPLDLATTPATPRQSFLNPSQTQSIDVPPLVPDETPEAELSTPTTSPAPSVALPNVGGPSMSVAEQIDQLRRRQQSVVLDEAREVNAGTKDSPQATLEPQRTVVPENLPSRRKGLHVSPPMVRAMSQPAHSMPTLPRTQSASSRKFFGLGKDKDRTPTTEQASSIDLRKIPTNESVKGEKKLFSLRSKHGSKSSIPRFVGRKKDSRVSTLARHFEQLSREFEKERKKDEKQRAAKMSHARAFLQRSTTKAIVEVYEDPDEAVQEPGQATDDSAMDKDTEGTKNSGEVDTHTDILSDAGADGDDATPIARPGMLQFPTDTSQPQAEERPNEDTATEAETDDQAQNTSQLPTDDEQGESDTEQSLLEGSALEEIADSLDPSTDIPLELPKQDKTNFMKILTNFWAERSASEWPALEYPISAMDHLFDHSDIIVREDEPSSLIAFTLDCEEYREKARKFHGRKDPEVLESEIDTEGPGIPTADWHMASEEGLEASMRKVGSKHLKFQFNEGSAKMLVKIFYAEQFDALRIKCGSAHRIIESLSRCLKYDSKGGKSKSVFLKTQDDRLMMKSLSPIETSAFLKFAPIYFEYMAEALFRDLPSVIAKMLGFFQVIIKNPLTNTEIKLDLLLMENLFYDRAPTRIFDLKGSMRNRKIQSTGEQNEVLLDENMVEYIYESPLFAREHSTKLLRASVRNDTLFLARQNVMDYSLMIAVDEAKKELVVGIIDCIRTYTWDKTLESWIKGRGFAGGGRNRPTVTSPREYKSRFREAMARYILEAPNCWHQFHVPSMHRPPAYLNAIGDDGAEELAQE